MIVSLFDSNVNRHLRPSAGASGSVRQRALSSLRGCCCGFDVVVVVVDVVVVVVCSQRSEVSEKSEAIVYPNPEYRMTSCEARVWFLGCLVWRHLPCDLHSTRFRAIV